VIRVLIVDDQQLVRSGFRMILEAEDDVTVVGEAADGAQAVDLARRSSPDVVLMDVQMPVMDGLAATRAITGGTSGTSGATPAVVILTTFDRDDYVFEALRAGAAGFLLKNAPPEQLVEAVRVVAAGDGLLAPAVTRRVIAELASRGSTPDPAERLAPLTDREREVLTLVAAGMSNAEIGAALYLGEATVKTHVSNMLLKLHLRDRVQAVILAYECGLVVPSGGTT
jgi:DNA-binding NarL/FixJ family response regulator